MIRWIAATLLATSLPSLAETQLTPEQFERDAAGKTLYFRDSNLDYSAEQYFPDRRVVLLHMGGQCMHGRWEPVGDQMCFLYEEDPGRWHCWHYIETPTGERLHRFVDEADEAPFELTIIKENAEPLQCPGPAIGVSFRPVP